MFRFFISILLVLCALPSLALASGPSTNAQFILDVLEKKAGTLVEDVKVGPKDRIAVVNLEAAMDASKTPSVALYDMMVMALSEKGVTVVERDRVGLAAAAIEGWADRLPVFVSATCGEACPEDVVDAAEASDSEPAEEESAGGPLAGLAKGLPSLPALSGGADAAPAPSATASYDGLMTLDLADWHTEDGKDIVTSVLSATHVLGYRPLFVGVTLEPTGEKGVMRRRARVDMMLRLINTKFGTVQWTKRVHFEESEKIPAVAVPLLELDRYSYSGDQFGASEGGSSSPLGGLLGK